MDPILTIIIDPEGAGGVQVSPYGDYIPGNGISYPLGTVVTLTAVFYLTVGQFDHWEGDLTGSANPTTITMDGDKSVTAVFIVGGTTVRLTTSVVGNGIISPSGGLFNPGDQILLQAIPDPDNVFVSWSGDIEGCEPVPGMPDNLQVIMDTDRHIIAKFKSTAPSIQKASLGIAAGAVVLTILAALARKRKRR